MLIFQVIDQKYQTTFYKGINLNNNNIDCNFKVKIITIRDGFGCNFHGYVLH